MYPGGPPNPGGQAYAPPTIYQQPPQYGQQPPAYGQQPGQYPAYPGAPPGAPPAYNQQYPYGAAPPGAPQPYGAPGAPQPYGATPGAPQPYGATPGAPQPYGATPGAPQPYGAAPGQQPYGAPPGQQPYGAPAPYQAPTTYQPSPVPAAPGRKKALLIGCSYPGSAAALRGCINDVECIRFCIKKNFGFQDADIVVLRDDQNHPDFTSTRANIMRAITWLVGDNRPGDSLFFHFSGHGSQKVDRDGDEDDGYDETILPTDHTRAGQITDDELNAALIRPLVQGARLHAVIDACHSGTALDLPYRSYNDRSTGRLAFKGRPNPRKDTRGGWAVQFGACKDSQTAADTNSLSGGTFTGAATFSFIQAIESYPKQNQTYATLMQHMGEQLRKMGGGSAVLPTGYGLTGLLTGVLNQVLTGSTGGQSPKLCSNIPFDLYTTPFNI